MRSLIPALAGLLGLAAATPAGAACDVEVYGIDTLKAAIDNPAVTEICVGEDLQGTLSVTTPPGFEDRWIEIRSMEPATPITWKGDPVDPDTLLRCDAESTVSIWLRDLVLDGEGSPRAVEAGGLCSVNMESVQLEEFDPPAGGAAVEIQVDPLRSVEIVRCWFDRIGGTAIHVGSGVLHLTQSMFTADIGGAGPGGLWLDGEAIAESRGNLFYGCASAEGGGAVAVGDDAWLLSDGDGFVGNRAPVGGALLAAGGALSVRHAVFAGNATCGDDCTPASTAGQGVTPPLEEDCNHTLVDWGELPAVEQTGGAEGAGGAVAVRVDGEAVRFTKSLFLANEAGEGRGGAVAILGPSVEGEAAAAEVGLLHCSLVDNRAARGAAVWGAAGAAGRLVAVGGLWLEHEGVPIQVEDAPWEVLLAANHTDGVALCTPPDGAAVHTLEETAGASPDLLECPAGCGDDAMAALCGAEDSELDLSLPQRPIALHFGVRLCPAPDDPWLHGTGLDGDEFQMPDGSAPDRGLTGFSCEADWPADLDGDGTPGFADCDDGDPAVHPFADEICNDVDDDCDGQVDEGVAVIAYLDGDGDGFGVEPPVSSCEAVEGTVHVGGDCDDTDGDVYPGAREIWGDGVDNDCNGEIDTDAQGCHSAGCFAVRVAPSDDGLQISARPGPAPWLALAGGLCFLRRIRRP